MKKQIKTVAAFAAAAAMMMAPVMTASADTGEEDFGSWWIQFSDGTRLVSDSTGRWIENPDGTRPVNEWFQAPTGLWYYMGADGYILTNTTTPDGYIVNADGVWVQGEAATTQQTDGANNVTDSEAVLKMYKDFIGDSSDFFPNVYAFVDLDADGIPECINARGHEDGENFWFRIYVCAGNEVKKGSSYNADRLYYAKGGNVLKILNNNTWENFYQLDKSSTGLLRQVGVSGVNLIGEYLVAGEKVTKERHDEYVDSFGASTEIPMDFSHTYKTIDEAYQAFLAQQ